MTDKKKIAVVGDPKAESKETRISLDTYNKAKNKDGVLKDKPSYRGKVIKNEEGDIANVKLHSGEVIKTTGVLSRAKALIAFNKDKSLYEKRVADFYKARERLSTPKK